MSKFTFKCQFPDYDEFTGDVIGIKSTTTVEFEAEDLKEVISEFENFLRGSGFKFDGNLEICNLDFYKENYFADDSFEIFIDKNQSLTESCSVCGLNKNIMVSNECFDKKCPKESW